MKHWGYYSELARTKLTHPIFWLKEDGAWLAARMLPRLVVYYATLRLTSTVMRAGEDASKLTVSDALDRW